ncbi:MAG: PKD domain-containing protein [Bacteroidales bacterium]|nr:PKD domain-containing protein [Bacteroidales bacterium]MCF8402482.1 PKD domain-containing protein [Bacteroidales bacterium]
MKKTFIATLIFFSLILSGIGQNTILTLSGHVLDEITGTPVSNHLVSAEIMSGGMTMTYDFITNASGEYGDSIPVFSQGSVFLYTFDCIGMIHADSGFFNPGNYTYNHDFLICNDSIPMGCTAMFSYSGSPAGGTTIFFSDMSAGNPTDWYWDFGDGQFSLEQNPIHDYADEGIYPVCLSISSPDSSCYDVFCTDVIVGNSVPDCENWFWYETWNSVDFTFMGESFPYPEAYYSWDFGDGTTGTGQMVDHSYGPNTLDSVLVSLTTFSYDPATGDSCEAFSSQIVWVGNQGNDCYNWFIYQTGDGFTFDFQGESIPPADSYVWDFGDNNSSSGQFVSHDYDESLAGQVVIVTLTTIHSTGGTMDTCIASSEQIISIGNNIPDCDNFFWYVPQGDFTFTFAGESIPFPATEYYWDFGDGSTASGQVIDHTFDPGLGDAFMVTLTTFSYSPVGDSCIAQSMQEVWINNGGWNCENWFWYESFDNLTFDFFGEAFPYPANEFMWDFGDGTVDFGPAVTHTYDPAMGDVFNVVLTTFSYDPATGDSCMATSSQPVMVGGGIPDCENWFWYESLNGFEYEFSGEALPLPATDYLWDFGDGSTSTGQVVTHTFDPSLGNVFNVCLTTISAASPMGDSCVATSCQIISLSGQSGQELFGMIYADNAPADFALVGLFGMDPAGSFNYEFTMTQPGTGSYFFDNIPEGDYYIFASLTPQSGLFFDYFPTYYGDEIFWFDADLISLGTANNPYDIHLVPITSYNSGSAQINGNVYLMNTKEGPGENIEVMLMDENNNAMRYIQTNEEGDFEFSGLGYGTYKLKVEMPGVNSEVATIILNEENEVQEVQFYVKDNSAYLNIKQSLVSIASIGNVFPNPATSIANIRITTLEETELLIKVVDQTGQIVSNFKVNANYGDQLIKVKTSQWNSGLYHIQLIDSEGNCISRKFIK